MQGVIAAMAIAVAALYGFIGLYIVPRLAQLADRSSGWIRAAQYGAAAFFVGCALTHLAIALHTVAEPELIEGHELAHLLPHIAQVVGGALFATIASTRLDVRLRTKEEARLEAESERLREQLERSQRLGSLGQLAGGIAHDFNNLLAVILGYGQLLSDKLDGHPQQRAQVDEIVSAAQRGTDLTRQLLMFSRGPAIDGDLTDVDRTIEASETLLRHAAGEAVMVETALDGDLPPVRLGRGHLEQILLNLALNARDAMPGGGRLTVRTERIARADGDTGVRVTVADSGHGMAPEVAARAFDPFFTTKPGGEGTGLGLSMVYGIVDRAGGELQLDSAPGEGTRLTIELPGQRGVAAADAAPEPEIPDVGDATVLVVEDQPSVRDIVRHTLADRGVRVLEARDGDQALEAFAAHAGAIDVIVTDIVMPRMSGIELVASLREQRPALPVVYMTGYRRQQSDVPDDSPVLQKPFTAGDLLAAVADVLPVGFLTGG